MNNKRIYDLCKTIYLENKGNKTSSFLRKKLLEVISKESRGINPIINKRITLSITGFNEPNELSEFLNEMNITLNNCLIYFLFNSRVKTFIKDFDSILIEIEYNETNEYFVTHFLEFLSTDENSILFMGLKSEILENISVEPSHVQFSNIEDLKILKNKKSRL